MVPPSAPHISANVGGKKKHRDRFSRVRRGQCAATSLTVLSDADVSERSRVRRFGSKAAHAGRPDSVRQTPGHVFMPTSLSAGQPVATAVMPSSVW